MRWTNITGLLSKTKPTEQNNGPDLMETLTTLVENAAVFIFKNCYIFMNIAMMVREKIEFYTKWGNCKHVFFLDLEYYVPQLAYICVVDWCKYPLDYTKSTIDHVKVESNCGNLCRAAPDCPIPLRNALARRCAADPS